MQRRKKIKFAVFITALLIAIFAIFYVLRSDHALLVHPKGAIAQSELKLITTNIFLMLMVVVPTFVLLFVVIWRYRVKNTQAKYDPEQSHGILKQSILWIIPAVVVAAMIVVTWDATHELDPYQPLKSEVRPLEIQVVALEWKWLFIYPEQGIATVNFVQFPEKTPINLSLSADGTPMNSFWLPQLSGQIYCMTGMTTKLHIIADGLGEYTGRAAEINGQGFADMTFVAKSISQPDFDSWVTQVKNSSLQLTDPHYHELAQSSENNPVALYSNVTEDLFNKIVMKYMPPEAQ